MHILNIKLACTKHYYGTEPSTTAVQFVSNKSKGKMHEETRFTEYHSNPQNPDY